MTISLLTLLMDAFNDSELEDLSYELRINTEDLPVPRLAGRKDRMRALILYCQQHGRFANLLTLCQQQRPEREWPDPTLPYTLAELMGDPLPPRLPFAPELLPIPSGPFTLGSDTHEPAEAPAHQVVLTAYFIGKYPVTNGQYAEFLRQNPAHTPPPSTGWFGVEPPPNRGQHPVVGVSWFDAVAYGRWLSQQTGQVYRLPTEAEWEKAARGTDGRFYPWGNEWRDGWCNAAGGGTTAVSTYGRPECLSPYGVADLLGNVQEWTSTIWGEGRQEPAYPYPYRADDGRENLEANLRNPRLRRIYRGGAYNDNPAQLRCTARGHRNPDSITTNRGFRIVMQP